jgi:hypothetical protein
LVYWFCVVFCRFGVFSRFAVFFRLSVLWLFGVLSLRRVVALRSVLALRTVVASPCSRASPRSGAMNVARSFKAGSRAYAIPGVASATLEQSRPVSRTGSLVQIRLANGECSISSCQEKSAGVKTPDEPIFDGLSFRILSYFAR